MRWIYLSPHFDDAVLSCGGWIWEQAHAGLPVEVWTICSGDPPNGPLSREARHCHRVWGTGTAQETVALRRLEDQAANRAIGATWRHLSLPDCIYRLSPRGDPLYPEAVNVSLHYLEAGLDQALAEEIQIGLEPDDHVACPLAIGGHVDHLLTRAAALRLGRPIWYYADLPYVLRQPTALAPAVQGLREAFHPITLEGVQAWLDGISAHASQMLMLFSSEGEMRATFRQHWIAQRGIRIWDSGSNALEDSAGNRPADRSKGVGGFINKIKNDSVKPLLETLFLPPECLAGPLATAEEQLCRMQA